MSAFCPAIPTLEVPALPRVSPSKKHQQLLFDQNLHVLVIEVLATIFSRTAKGVFDLPMRMARKLCQRIMLV